MIIGTFCMHMNQTTIILALVTTIAISTSVITEGSFFTPNHAYAASCKSINGNTVCKASPNEVCTHYGPHNIACTTRNFQSMTPIS